MKRWCTLLVAFCAFTLQQEEIPDHPEKLKFKPLDFKVPDPSTMRAQLSNGVVVYLAEDDALPLVNMQIYLHGGSFWDPQGKEGLATLTGTLMRTGGTKTREPKDIDEELEFLAAQLSVSIGSTTGSASLSVMKKDLDKGLELLTDILRNPTFRQDKLDLLKAQTLDQLKARNDQTASIEGREADLLLYGDYPINRHPTKASIEATTREDLLACHEKIFTPSNMIIAAAGAFRREEFLKKLEGMFRDWHKTDAKFEIPKVKYQPEPGIYCFHKGGKNINQGRVTMAHLGIDIHHPDVHALRLLSYIYGGGGFSSRLMQKVRTEEGLAYDVHSDFSPGIGYVGTLRIAFQSKSETCAYAAKLCLQELEKLQKNGVSERELRDAKQFYLDGFPSFFFKTKFQTVSTFAAAELNDLPKDYYQTYREKIACLTIDDIKRAANEHLKPDRLVWTIVGDIPKIKEGEGRAKLTDFGTPKDIPLADPLTLERPK